MENHDFLPCFCFCRIIFRRHISRKTRLSSKTRATVICWEKLGSSPRELMTLVLSSCSLATSFFLLPPRLFLSLPAIHLPNNELILLWQFRPLQTDASELGRFIWLICGCWWNIHRPPWLQKTSERFVIDFLLLSAARNDVWQEQLLDDTIIDHRITSPYPPRSCHHNQILCCTHLLLPPEKITFIACSYYSLLFQIRLREVQLYYFFFLCSCFDLHKVRESDTSLRYFHSSTSRSSAMNFRHYFSMLYLSLFFSSFSIFPCYILIVKFESSSCPWSSSCLPHSTKSSYCFRIKIFFDVNAFFENIRNAHY